MKMVEVESLNDLNSFQPNKWNIAEPDKETLLLREDSKKKTNLKISKFSF